MRAFLAVCAAVALPFAASAQVVCGPGQQACGTMCFNPAAGQTCGTAGAFGAPGSPGGAMPGAAVPVFPALPAVVCGAGETACGTQCFSPASGQRCFEGGIVCGAGQVACGDQCISPASGQTCNE